MGQYLMSHEGLLRLGSFFSLFFVLVLLELRRPFRPPARHRLRHYGKNLALILISSLLTRLLFPLVAVGAALLAEEKDWGLLHLWSLPEWLGIGLTLLLFDLLLYFQHRAFHAFPWLWSLHRVHHTDPDFDTSTGIRFHPLEMVLSMMIKVTLALVLGAHPAGVVLFEILLNASSLFTHANLELPEPFDRRLRRLLVTPGMHRVHHSVEPAEMNSCFGFFLSIWDYLFRTYRERPLAVQKTMPLGVNGWTDEPLARLLTQPFRGLFTGRS